MSSRLASPLATLVAVLVVAVAFGSLGTLLASGSVATYLVFAGVAVLVVAGVRFGARRAGRTDSAYW